MQNIAVCDHNLKNVNNFVILGTNLSGHIYKKKNKKRSGYNSIFLPVLSKTTRSQLRLPKKLLIAFERGVLQSIVGAMQYDNIEYT